MSDMIEGLETTSATAPVSAPAELAPAGGRGMIWRRLIGSRYAVASVVLLLILVATVGAPLIAPDAPSAQDLLHSLQGPSSHHWLGTDQFGRDNLSRLLYGGRVSLWAGLEAVITAVVIGLPFGLIAGYFGGWGDSAISWVTDAVMCFPGILLAVGIISALGPGLTHAMIAVGIVLAPRMLRVTRAVAGSIKHETFIDASRSVGCSSRRLIVAHILPNALPPIIVELSILLATGMLSEAGLSFLGLGAQAPTSSWGSMLGDGYRYVNQERMLIVYPGLAMTITIMCIFSLGDAIRGSLVSDRERFL